VRTSIGPELTIEVDEERCGGTDDPPTPPNPAGWPWRRSSLGTIPSWACSWRCKSLDASADAGIRAVLEAEEALHWAIQGARIAYTATAASAPVEVRSGADGPTGIFRLPLPQLVDLARSHLTRSFTADEWRSFTAEACARYAIEPCAARTRGSAWPAIPEDPVRPALPAQDDRPLAGTRITVVGIEPPDEGLGAEFDRFKEHTGIDVAYTANPDTSETQIAAAVARGDPPDLGVWAQPGAVRDYARDGELIDLSSYLDPAEVRRQVGDYLVDAASVRSGYFGVPAALSAKGLSGTRCPSSRTPGTRSPRPGTN
jgi:hypothetical protein